MGINTRYLVRNTQLSAGKTNPKGTGARFSLTNTRKIGVLAGDPPLNVKLITGESKRHFNDSRTFFLLGAETLDLMCVKVFSRNLESSGDGIIFSGLLIPK